MSKNLNSTVLANIDEYSERLALNALEDMPLDALIPLEQLKNKFKLTFEENITQFLEKAVLGLSAIEEAATLLYKSNPEGYSENSFNQINGLKDNFPLLGITKSKALSPREICGLSTDAVKLLNDCAAYYYENKNYVNASPVYMILTHIESDNYGNWLGFANSEFFLNNFERAKNIYQCALQVNSADPFCHLYLSSCYRELGQGAEALKCIDDALNIIRSNPSFSDLEADVKKLKKSIKQD